MDILLWLCPGIHPGSNGRCLLVPSSPISTVVTAESPFYSLSVLSTTPNPSGRKSLQTAVHSRCCMPTRISGYAVPASWHPALKTVSTLAGYCKDQALFLSSSFRVIANITTASLNRADGSPASIFQVGWSFWIHSCQRRFYFISWDEDRL